MVTACTNTGASLLFGMPLKFIGKRSAATSPIKEKDLNLSRRSVQKVELIQIIFFSVYNPSSICTDIFLWTICTET